MELQFRLLLDLQARVGESPVFDERSGCLYFVDILARRLYRLQLGPSGTGTGVATGLPPPDSWTFESEVGSLGLAASGRLVLALRDRLILFDPDSGARQELCTVEAELPETRLNDGKVGPDGAFWVGSMDDRPEKQPIASLYRVDGAGRVERKVEGLIISNGLAWTADGETMFHADSRGPWVDRWDFDRWTGAISGRRRFATLDDATGRPDGGACDAEGCYWSAGVSAGRINRFAPDGSLLEAHPVPAPAPTMPCFGGPDFRTLFLTSLSDGRADLAPGSGGLFAAPAPVAGFAPWRFLDM